MAAANAGPAAKSRAVEGNASFWQRTRRALGLLRHLPPGARGAALKRMLETSSARQERLERAVATPPDTVVFICHGNIMRSAFAVAYVKARYPDLALRVLGGGTHASPGRPAQESALRVAKELGYPLGAHRATPLAELSPGGGALLLCMDRANEGNTMRLWPEHASRVFLLGDVLKSGEPGLEGGDRWVTDPYARGDGATRYAFERIAALVDEWVNLLGR